MFKKGRTKLEVIRELNVEVTCPGIELCNKKLAACGWQLIAKKL